MQPFCRPQWPIIALNIRMSKRMKRSDHENLTITLTPNPDIAAALGKIKKPNQLLVGFALETNDEDKNALSKMEKKKF